MFKLSSAESTYCFQLHKRKFCVLRSNSLYLFFSFFLTLFLSFSLSLFCSNSLYLFFSFFLSFFIICCCDWPFYLAQSFKSIARLLISKDIIFSISFSIFLFVYFFLSGFSFNISKFSLTLYNYNSHFYFYFYFLSLSLSHRHNNLNSIHFPSLFLCHLFLFVSLSVSHIFHLEFNWVWTCKILD